jgi:hypothetical protein
VLCWVGTCADLGYWAMFAVAKRPVKQISEVSQDAAGLRELAAARSWRALLQLSQQAILQSQRPDAMHRLVVGLER